jgi:hypothetical protein
MKFLAVTARIVFRVHKGHVTVERETRRLSKRALLIGEEYGLEVTALGPGPRQLPTHTVVQCQLAAYPECIAGIESFIIL